MHDVNNTAEAMRHANISNIFFFIITTAPFGSNILFYVYFLYSIILFFFCHYAFLFVYILFTKGEVACGSKKPKYDGEMANMSRISAVILCNSPKVNYFL